MCGALCVVLSGLLVYIVLSPGDYIDTLSSLSAYSIIYPYPCTTTREYILNTERHSLAPPLIQK